MLSLVLRAVLAGSALVATACALDVKGLAAGDGDAMTAPPTNLDDASVAGSHNPSPSPSTTATGMKPGGAEAGASACDNAAGPCVVVPGGWTLVAFAATRAAACPAGFSASPSTDVVEGPDATHACSCGACLVTAQPSCASGAIASYNDLRARSGAGTCASVDTPSPLSNNPPGACLTDIFTGDYSLYYVQYDSPPASGGACTSTGTMNGGAVTYAAQERACTLDTPQAASCTGDVCRPKLPAGYGACIAAPGALPCPQGPLGVQHVVGTSAAFTCGTCACTTTATCSGTITLYTDTACMRGANPVAADVCLTITGIGYVVSYQSYQYDGGQPENVACQVSAAAPAPAPGPVTLANEETLCCAQ